ncbi:MAG TPA: transglutaminase family protein [Polyangiaceae bacterium]|nr:transglutaminase family protein [Polyangiaceae bacterium]
MSKQACTAWLEVGHEFAEFELEEVAWSGQELERLGRLVRERLAHDSDLPRAARHVVFEQLSFVREVDDASLRFVLLPSVLRLRRGNCVGLGTLLVSLIQLAGGDARGVLRPGHFHVRVRHQNVARNLEPLRGGEEMPDDWYESRFPFVGPVSYYARSLSSNEVLGVLEYNIGNERRKGQRLGEAERAYTRAVSHFPEFAEAHASLGTVLHVQGKLGAAERAYRKALRMNRTLPGLEWNLELLLAERERAGTAQSAPGGLRGR